MRTQAILVVVYLAAIIAANLLIVAFGPSVAILNAFVSIGLGLVTRDKLHEAWAGRGLVLRMGLLILTGSLLSYLLNKDALPIARASFAAFALASIADGIVYYALRRYGWMQRSNGSNLAGAAVDSLVFPALAFGGFPLAIMAGQFAAKALGGLVWSWLLSKDSKEVQYAN